MAQLMTRPNDTATFLHTLGEIVRVRGMTEVASASGLTREALCKALFLGSQPRFDIIRRVCCALGVRLVAQPIYA